MEKILQLYPDIINNLTNNHVYIMEKEINGVQRLSTEERRKLSELNMKYKEKFGFPFIICSKNNDVYNIFSEILNRLQNSREVEIHIALREVKNIVNLRIHEIVI